MIQAKHFTFVCAIGTVEFTVTNLSDVDTSARDPRTLPLMRRTPIIHNTSENDHFENIQCIFLFSE